jgi:hypothetical protein
MYTDEQGRDTTVTSTGSHNLEPDDAFFFQVLGPWARKLLTVIPLGLLLPSAG